MTDMPTLKGATVFVLDGGEHITFVTRDRLNTQQSIEYLQKLSALFPHQGVALVPNIDEVIVAPPKPQDATARTNTDKETQS